MTRFKKVPKTNHACGCASGCGNDAGECGEKKKRLPRTYILLREKGEEDSASGQHYSCEQEQIYSQYGSLYEDELWELLGVLPAQQAAEYGETGIFRIDSEAALVLEEEISKYAFERLLNYLSHRERSVYECRAFFRNLPLHQKIADSLIEKAKKYNYLNELRFAELRVQSFISRNKSLFEAKGDLIRNRIDPQITEDVLQRLYDSENSETVILNNIEKGIRRYPQNNYKDYHKCVAYMMKKGFKYDSFAAKLKEYYTIDES